MKKVSRKSLRQFARVCTYYYCVCSYFYFSLFFSLPMISKQHSRNLVGSLGESKQIRKRQKGKERKTEIMERKKVFCTGWVSALMWFLQCLFAFLSSSQHLRYFYLSYFFYVLNSFVSFSVQKISGFTGSRLSRLEKNVCPPKAVALSVSCDSLN